MPAKILIADDDADIRTILRFELRALYDVIEAPDGRAAWDLFERERPHLVITDLGMPGINGLDLIDMMRAHKDLSRIPIIILTGATIDEEIPNEVWRMGTSADAFMEKPVEAAKLRAEIDRLLKGRAGYRPLPPGKGHYD